MVGGHAMISRDVNGKERDGKPLVLVVDDDPHVAALARIHLERDGYRVAEANDGIRGLELARRERPSLVVLDLMLPGLDGFEVCRKLHLESMVPVIMLTARVEETDRLEGLDLGADDYMTKPFSPRELAARVRAVLRRADRESALSAHPELCFGTISVNMRTRQAMVDGAQLKLTPTEFRLLTLLVQEPGRIFSRDRHNGPGLRLRFRWLRPHGRLSRVVSAPQARSQKRGECQADRDRIRQRLPAASCRERLICA